MTRQRDAPRNRRVSPYHELLFLGLGYGFDYYCICMLVRQGQHSQEVCPSIETSITTSDRTAGRRAAINKFSPGRRILYVTAELGWRRVQAIFQCVLGKVLARLTPFLLSTPGAQRRSLGRAHASMVHVRANVTCVNSMLTRARR